MITELNEEKKHDLLKKFMQEHFPYGECRKMGIFTKEMRGNYKAQAEKICHYFGYKTVFEYGAEEIRCHVSYTEGCRPLHINDKGQLRAEPFITVIPSIYD